MLDETSLSRAAALIIRPLLTKDSTDDAPIRFGGKPRLPQDLDWPECAYHVAEINFASLPRQVEIEDQVIALPDMPERGTAFLFLRLYSDDIYQSDCAVVLYTPDDVCDLPERAPPSDLPSLKDDDDFEHVQRDGLSSCGKLLVLQPAEVVAMLGDRAVNPLRTNMIAAEGGDVSDQRTRYDRHQTAVSDVLYNDMDDDPDAPTRIKLRMPDKFVRYNHRFKDRYFDWQFIFDWSKAFYLSCHDMALKHLADMKAEKAQPLLVWFFLRNRTKDRANVERVQFGSDWRPFGWVHNHPEDRAKAFDVQARAFMTLARQQAGQPQTEITDAFLDLLDDIVVHYEKTDDDGYNLGPRNDVLDMICKGHDWHAGNTLVNAKNAFETATQRAALREKEWLATLSPEERWRRMTSDSKHDAETQRQQDFESDNTNCYSMGDMPLQMFGHGVEIQHAVTQNAENILLFQLGDPSSGIPIDFGGDGLLQLWISPEDLAAGRFDRVTSTLDCT